MLILLSACSTELSGKWEDESGVHWEFNSAGNGRVYAGHSGDDMVNHGYYDNGDAYDDGGGKDEDRDDNTIPFTYTYSDGKLDIKFKDETPTYGDWGDDEDGLLPGSHFVGELDENGKNIEGEVTTNGDELKNEESSGEIYITKGESE
jgi:hypothetical protein